MDESIAGPARNTTSRTSHRAAPYGDSAEAATSRPSSHAPSWPPSRASATLLSMLRVFYDQTHSALRTTSILPHDQTLPQLEDEGLQDLTVAEAVLFPLPCSSLHMLVDVCTCLTTIESTMSSSAPRASTQSCATAPALQPSNEGALAELQALVRDLATRVTASATITIAPAPCASPASSCQPLCPAPQPPCPASWPALPPPLPDQASAFDWDIPRYSTESGCYFSDLKAYAARNPQF